jgi:hypothetical protein
MASVQESREFAGLDADQAYQAADKAFEEAGFDIWKRRPLGWIVLANKDAEGGKITANAACRPGQNAVVTFSLECPVLDEEALQEMLEALFGSVAHTAAA